MSNVHSERSFKHLYTMLVCPCGAELRVKKELAGTEVRCWSCQGMVPVPRPLWRGDETLLLRRGLSDVFDWRPALAVGLGAVVLTGALTVRGVAAALGLALAVVGAFAYGEWIRTTGREQAENDDEGEDDGEERVRGGRAGPARRALRGVVALAAALAATAPWWIRNGAWAAPLRLTPTGLAWLAAGTLLVPLLMLVAFAEDGAGPLGWRRLSSRMVRHSVHAAAALAILPLGIILGEFAAFAACSLLGWLQLFIHDLFPNPDALFPALGLTDAADNVTLRLPNMQFLRMYLLRLGQGYTLTGALPGSLSAVKTRATSPWTLYQTPAEYLRMRMTITLLVSAMLLMALCLQARWLGLLATLDPRRPAP